MEDFNADDQLITFLREYNRIFAYPTKTTATFVYKVDPETGIDPETNEFGIDSVMITGSFFGGKTITGRDFDFARDLLFTRVVNGIDISKISEFGSNLCEILSRLNLCADFVKKMDYNSHLMVRPMESSIECDLPGVCLGDIGEMDKPGTVYAYEYFNGSKKLVSLQYILESKEKKNIKMYDIYLNNRHKKVYYNTKIGTTYVPIEEE